jgi:hypothetical protein
MSDKASSNKSYYETHREEIRKKQKEYYEATYTERREEKNRRRTEKRRQTNWYEANKEKQRANTRAYYYAHKEEQRAKAKARVQALRTLVLEHYGKQCACCGETEIKFLSIDHINNDGAAHRKVIGKGGTTLYYWLRDNEYPDGFQILCHNCNFAKGIYGICPHQERME